MGKPEIACQLIIFGPRSRNDLPGVLKDVSEAGYAGIEGGGPGFKSDKEMRKLLGGNGLKLAGVHMGFGNFENLDETIAYMKALDCNLLMCSGVGDTESGLAAYEFAAEAFNDVGRRCREDGIKFCYHNHSWEFKKYDGVIALEKLYELTDSAYVHLCVDVYWVQHGGESPVDFLKKYLDRVATVHFKDMKDGTFAEVGQGIVDFPGIMEVISDKRDLEWIIVEQDNTQRTPKESVVMSRQYIKEKLGL